MTTKKAKAKGEEEALNDDVKVCKGGKEALKGDADALNGEGKRWRAMKRRDAARLRAMGWR